MDTNYRYIGIGRHYFCLEQNLILLAWMLISGRGLLRLAALRVSASDVLKAMIKIALYRLGANRRVRTLELPFFGNVCREVHGGHKLFNFRRGSVTKRFSPQLAQDEVEREIVATAARGRLNFSPNVIRYSLDRRWYEEDYIPGEPGWLFYGADNEAFWRRFHGDIVPFLEQILRIEPLVSVRLGAYVDDVTSRLRAALERLECAPDMAALVLKFAAEYLEDDLRAAADEVVLTAFSHGDFLSGNILKTRDRSIVIDWESEDRRSILFDFYSFLFGELHKGRAAIMPRQEIDSALRALESNLTRKIPEAPDIKALADIYRKLFYLERLLMLAERDQPDKPFPRVVVRTIEVFSQYEAKPADRIAVGRPRNKPGATAARAHARNASRRRSRTPLVVAGALLLSLASETAVASALG